MSQSLRFLKKTWVKLNKAVKKEEIDPWLWLNNIKLSNKKDKEQCLDQVDKLKIQPFSNSITTLCHHNRNSSSNSNNSNSININNLSKKRNNKNSVQSLIWWKFTVKSTKVSWRRWALIINQSLQMSRMDLSLYISIVYFKGLEVEKLLMLLINSNLQTKNFKINLN